MAEKILLVDDNEADNVYHNRVFRKLGLEETLRVCENAEEALTFLRQDPAAQDISLICVDINMPVMDGWEFLKAYESLPGRHPTSVIMMSSSMNPDDQRRALQHRCVLHFVTKPLTPEKLSCFINSGT